MEPFSKRGLKTGEWVDPREEPRGSNTATSEVNDFLHHAPVAMRFCLTPDPKQWSQVTVDQKLLTPEAQMNPLSCLHKMSVIAMEGLLKHTKSRLSTHL